MSSSSKDEWEKNTLGWGRRAMTGSLADRELRSNRNDVFLFVAALASLADRELRSNRNVAAGLVYTVLSLADRELRSNRSRSGFGTSNLWDQLGEIVPINPPILRGAIRRMADQDACSLSDLMGTVRQIIDEIHGACVTGWHHEEFSLFGTTLTVPLLDLDHTAIDRYRADYSE